MTKAALEKRCEAQREQIRQLALALRLLDSHARGSSGNLPAMHDADKRFICKMVLQTINL